MSPLVAEFDADNEPELLGLERQATRIESTVSTGGSRSPKVFAIVGLVVAALIGWSILASPANENVEVDEASSDLLAQEGQADDETDELESTEPSQSTTSTPDDSLEVLESPPAGASTDEDGVGAIAAEVSDAGDGPILPGSGLALVANQFRNMSVINLESGTVLEYPHRFEELLLQVDRYLVYRTTDGGVSILDSQQPEVRPEELLTDNWYVFAARPAADGAITVLSDSYLSGGNSGIIEATIDLASGEVLDRQPADVSQLNALGPFGIFGFDTDLFSPATGGVYVAEDDGFRKVLDGRVVASNDEFVLVQTCDEALACSRQWHAVGTWEPIVRALPEVAFESGDLQGNGRVLLYFTSTVETGFGIEIFDVERDRPVDLPPFAGSLPAVSPDGRYVAYVSQEGEASVLDLDTEESTTIAGNWAPGSLAFIDLP